MLDDAALDAVSHAIVVAGHSVLVDETRMDEDAGWSLLDFQRGEPRFYIGHVRHAVELAAPDPTALLIFSGGQSRAAAGPRSEGQSYWRVADRFSWFGSPSVRSRALTEEFSRDSFENLLFGICRFRECTGRWPAHVTLVSWAFKECRFGLHREAIRWPADRFTYAGPNNPEDLAQAKESERRALTRYTADPYSAGPFFQAKRRERNPYRRQHGYAVSCPGIEGLLNHGGPELYRGPVPWTESLGAAAGADSRNSAPP
jgi:hypothetical protein